VRRRSKCGFAARSAGVFVKHDVLFVALLGALLLVPSPASATHSCPAPFPCLHGSVSVVTCVDGNPDGFVDILPGSRSLWVLRADVTCTYRPFPSCVVPGLCDRVANGACEFRYSRRSALNCALLHEAASAEGNCPMDTLRVPITHGTELSRQRFRHGILFRCLRK
jgi:hypothetical protein